MRIAMALIAVTFVFGASACKKKKEAATGDNMGSSMGSGMMGSDMGSGSAAMGSGSAAMGSGSDMGSAAMGSGSAAGSDMGSGSGSGSGGDMAMAHKTGNCPSTVLGAITTVKIVKNIVVVSITATDKDAIAAIHKRTAELMKEKADKTAKTGTGHDQKGTHGGAEGMCPVYFNDGTGTQTTTKTGTDVQISPRDGKPEDLKKKIEDRIAKAAEWVKANVKPGDKGNEGGVGGGSGDHGSNHSGSGDAKGVERKKAGDGKGTGDGKGSGKGNGGGGKKGSGKSS